MEKKNFTLAVYSENRSGLLSRITMLFVKRHINIDSVTVSESEIQGISRYTIAVRCTEEIARKLVAQIEKQIEVVRAYYHDSTDTIEQEIALFKVEIDKWNTHNLQLITESNNGVITFLDSQFVVIQKSGKRSDVEKFYDELAPFGLMQFVRSGSVAISKSEMKISEIIK